jgi:hypothetical protein
MAGAVELLTPLLVELIDRAMKIERSDRWGEYSPVGTLPTPVMYARMSQRHLLNYKPASLSQQ